MACDICHCQGRGWLDGEDAMPGKGLAGIPVVCACDCHRAQPGEPRRFVVWGHGRALAGLVRTGSDADELGHELARARGHRHLTRADWCVEVRVSLPDLAEAIYGDPAVLGFLRLPERES